jgi:predicted RNA-binding protein with PUA-like domain
MEQKISPVSLGHKEQETNTNNRQYWLMKSEPQLYGVADLKKEKQTIWDGVRNYQARNFLRQMKEGDLAFFYHSNTTNPGIVGLMEIVQSHVVDPSQFDPKSKYYDPKSDIRLPRWHTVKVEFVRVFSQAITLKQLKEKFTGEQLILVKKGNRLSVMPVPEKVASDILAMDHNL